MHNSHSPEIFSTYFFDIDMISLCTVLIKLLLSSSNQFLSEKFPATCRINCLWVYSWTLCTDIPYILLLTNVLIVSTAYGLSRRNSGGLNVLLVVCPSWITNPSCTPYSSCALFSHSSDIPSIKNLNINKSQPHHRTLSLFSICHCQTQDSKFPTHMNASNFKSWPELLQYHIQIYLFFSSPPSTQSCHPSR